MGRAPCCDKENVKRGPWSPDEDATLKTYVETHGTGGNWIALPRKAGLRRCGKSCRLRWLNYLRPDIKHGGFTEEEDNIICSLYTQMGSRWSAIASQLPGRTDNDVKNYWNTKLKKKLIAGKVTLKKLTHDENDIILPLSITQNPKKTHKNSDYPFSQNQISQPSLVNPILTNDAISGSKIDEETMNFDLIHNHQFYSNSTSEVMNSIIVGSSEISASSSISDSSSSIGLEYYKNNNGGVLLPSSEHASDDSKDKFFMDFGFGFPFEFVNDFNFHDQRVGEFATSYFYPELVDFSYVDIKPH